MAMTALRAVRTAALDEAIASMPAKASDAARCQNLFWAGIPDALADDPSIEASLQVMDLLRARLAKLRAQYQDTRYWRTGLQINWTLGLLRTEARRLRVLSRRGDDPGAGTASPAEEEAA